MTAGKYPFLALTVLGFVFGQTLLHSDDNLDSLFDQGLSDQVAQTPAKDSVPQINQPFRAFGTFALDATGIRGVDGKNSTSVYVNSSLKVGIDIRPDDQLRLQGSVISELPSANSPFLTTPTSPFVITTNASGSNLLQYSAPIVDELFVDYTLGSWALLRLGQFGLTWGQARLVTNYGNLVLGTNQGLTTKATFPIGSGTLQVIASGYGALAPDQLPSNILAAGSADQTWGPLTCGVALAYDNHHELQGSGYAKTSFWGSDWYAEAVAKVLPLDTWEEFHGTLGWLWQGGFPVCTLTLENQVSKFKDLSSGPWFTTKAALSLDGKSAWAGLIPKMQWSQAWEDLSGQLILALVYQPEGFLSFTLGFPWTYGGDTSRFVLSNPDPGGRRLSVGLKGSCSYSF